MATYIKTKTKAQKAALLAAFGWQSFPNGESGYANDREIIAVMRKHGALKKQGGYAGCPALAGDYDAIEYWPISLWRELATIAAQRKLRYPWPKSSPVPAPVMGWRLARNFDGEVEIDGEWSRDHVVAILASQSCPRGWSPAPAQKQHQDGCKWKIYWSPTYHAAYAAERSKT
jgi:hypothetical protein